MFSIWASSVWSRPFSAFISSNLCFYISFRSFRLFFCLSPYARIQQFQQSTTSTCFRPRQLPTKSVALSCPPTAPRSLCWYRRRYIGFLSVSFRPWLASVRCLELAFYVLASCFCSPARSSPPSPEEGEVSLFCQIQFSTACWRYFCFFIKDT